TLSDRCFLGFFEFEPVPPRLALFQAIKFMTSHDRTLTRAVIQVPKLIRPPTDATPVEAASAPRPPRALPDDFLREASARLGIMSLVAAALWIAGTIFGRLALRSMQVSKSSVDLTMVDAIAGVTVLVSLLVFAYTRRANRDPRRILDLGLVYMVF